MLDADLTYDIAELPRFIEQLEDGGELVLGDRLEGIHPGAMPWLHRYVGNPLLTGLLNRLFGTEVKDAHCGMRALRRDLLPELDLRTSGMELASEMVIRAAKMGHDIRQFPDRLPPARRRVQALDLAGRMEAPALPARPQPVSPLRPARGDHGRDRRPRDGHRADPALPVRPGVGPARR